MIKLQDAKQLSNGTTLYSKRSYNRQGQPHRARVTSVKTWKRDSSRVLIGLKHGMYVYLKINEYDLDDWTLSESEALAARGA